VPARFFVDDNSRSLGKALAAVRSDVVLAGDRGCPVQRGEADLDWLPKIGAAGLILITRDVHIRRRPVERQALIDHGVRAVFLAGAGNLNSWEQLTVLVSRWDAMEEALRAPPPLMLSLSRSGIRAIAPAG